MKTTKITERYCTKCDAFTETEVIGRDIYNGNIIDEGYNKCKVCGRNDRADIDLFEFRETGESTSELTQRETYLIAGWVKCLGIVHGHDFTEEETELCTKIMDTAYPQNKGAKTISKKPSDYIGIINKRPREPIPTKDMTLYEAQDIVKYVGMKDPEPEPYTPLTTIGFSHGVTECHFCGTGISYNELKHRPMYCHECIEHAREMVILAKNMKKRG